VGKNFLNSSVAFDILTTSSTDVTIYPIRFGLKLAIRLSDFENDSITQAFLL